MTGPPRGPQGPPDQTISVKTVPISFVLAKGETHDGILITPDGIRYWPQIDRELVA